MKVLQIFWKYFVIVVKAIAKFLHFAYAPEITIGVLAVLLGLFYSGLLGFLLFLWAIGLLINEIKQKPPTPTAPAV
jgi:hypothetical protein